MAVKVIIVFNIPQSLVSHYSMVGMTRILTRDLSPEYAQKGLLHQQLNKYSIMYCQRMDWNSGPWSLTNYEVPALPSVLSHHSMCKRCVKNVIGLVPKVGEKQSKKSFFGETFLKEICLHVGNVLMFAQFLWRRMHNKDFFWPLHNKVWQKFKI